MKEEFFEDLMRLPVSYVASKWMIDRIPHVFDTDNHKHIVWKEELSKKIGVDSRSIVLTGSSCVGLSLNPYKNFRLFTDKSDIDVAIISNQYFDTAWYYLRSIKGSVYHKLNPIEKNAIDHHKQSLVYHGSIATDKILQLLPFAHKWIPALEYMSTVDPTIDRTVNARIYKDFEALRAYHISNLLKRKDDLLKISI